MPAVSSSYTQYPLARALWPYVLVGAALSFALRYLVEGFTPSVRDTVAQLYPLQLLIFAAGIVVLLRCPASVSQ